MLAGIAGAALAYTFSKGAAFAVVWGMVCGLLYLRWVAGSASRLLDGNLRAFAALGLGRIVLFGLLATLLLLVIAPPWSIGIYLVAFLTPFAIHLVVFARSLSASSR